MNTPAIELLLEGLDRAYDQTSWHGPNLRGGLRGVEPAQATWRPASGRHSIAEQVLHCAYWKYVARRRLTGEKRGSFVLEGSNWFPVEPPIDVPTWKGMIGLLDLEHEQLRAAVAELDPSRLDRAVSKPSAQKPVTARRLILGIAAHDLYHAGQIQLLRRLAPAGARE